MDWLTIVFALIFFVLPLIQQVLEAKNRTRAGEEEGHFPDLEGGSDRFPEPFSGDVEPVGGAGARRDSGWSFGWGEWPGAEADPEHAPAMVLEEEPPAIAEIPADSEPEFSTRFEPGWRREPRSHDDAPAVASPLPQPRRISTGEAGTEAPLIRSGGTDPERATPQMVAAATVFETDGPLEVVRLDRSTNGASASRYAALVRSGGGPDGLRQAIVLSEILGPPRSIRE